MKVRFFSRSIALWSLVSFLILAWMVCPGTRVLAQDHPYTPQSELDACFAGGWSLDSQFSKTYTPEELKAMDRALEAMNMNRRDMEFKKDYTKGYDAFPLVLDMMAHPLNIAPYMDGIVASIDACAGNKVFAVPDLLAGAMLLPSVDKNLVPSADEITSERNEIFYQAGPEYIVRMSKLPPQSFFPILFSIERANHRITDALTPLTEDELKQLRVKMPQVSSWHDVFKSPYGEDEEKKLDEILKDKPEDYLFKIADKINYSVLLKAYALLPTSDMIASIPKEAFPKDKPQIFDTPWGRMAIGTYGDDTYTGDFAILIEPGGNDVYTECRIGAANGSSSADRAGFFIDMGGNDKYYCFNTNITQGAAILGVASFYDLGNGNDIYQGGHFSQGAAICGFASFYDDGGCDNYSAKSYVQGAATFGVGVFVDAAPKAPEISGSPANKEGEEIDETLIQNNRFDAWTMGQALSRMMGVAICHSGRGNDTYYAGGVYLDAPLFNDRYQSFSQGFAIGSRDVDYAGGIAFLLDDDGNDYYLGDIYNQGVGYWYSAGFIYDRAGNDNYEMTQYGQGSGIHLAIGGIIDNAGHDSYVMTSGLGEGGSHDYAASVQMDRGGNDKYLGATSSNGCGLTNSVGLFFERGGDDIYGANSDACTLGGGRWDRDTGSIGVFVDVDGNDFYPGKAHDNRLWTQTFFGAGIDVKKEAAQGVAKAPAPAEEQMPANIDLPEVISYQGEMTDEVFDKLWEIASRWEVGDNRWIVPKARERLLEFGSVIIPKIDENFEDSLGLAYRSYEDILPKLYEKYPDEVKAMLEKNLSSEKDIRKKNAMGIIGKISIKELADKLVPLLDRKDFRKQAVGVLGSLGSNAGNEKIRTFLEPDTPENLIMTSARTLIKLGVTNIYPELRKLLDHDFYYVREGMIAMMAESGNAQYFMQNVTTDLDRKGRIERMPQIAESPVNHRTMISLLRFLAKAPEFVQSAKLYDAVEYYLSSSDWVTRAHAVRVFQHWQTYKGDEWKKTQEMIQKRLEKMKETEKDFHVMFVLNDV